MTDDMEKDLKKYLNEVDEDFLIKFPNAVELGETETLFALGQYYFMKSNYIKSAELLELAVSQGHELAGEWLSQVKKQGKI